jgi:hypothetical protein
MGFNGFMADFAEYIPYYSNSSIGMLGSKI